MTSMPHGRARPTLDSAILAAVASRGTARRTDILAALAEDGISASLPEFYASVRRLLSDGAIERHGEKRGTRYAVRQEARA